MEQLPIYKITIDPEYANEGEDLGIEMIAFVKNPAVLTKGIAFSSEKKHMTFADEKKMRIAAPALIPMNIYRNDAWGEYYVQFSAEEIEKLHLKFMKNLSNRNIFNLEHDASSVAPAYVLEAWLVGKDPKSDRSWSEFGIEVPSGTLFMVSQVTDKTYFEQLVAEERTGFSIEGFLGLKLSQINKQTKMKVDLKKSKRYSAKKKMAEAGVDENQDLTIVAESIDPNQTVIVIDENLQPVEGWTGEVLIEGYETVKIVDGVITEIVETANTEMAEMPAEVKEEVKTEVKEEVKMQITPEEQTAIVNEVMQILNPKFDEIYGMIAEVKSAMMPEEEVVTETPVEMSLHQKLSAVVEFLNKPNIN